MACFITVTILWVLSVCLHEFGHAIVAYYGGDTSVRDKGYLTLNPLKYTHPVYSLLMPALFMMVGGIGLPGGAVYIDRDRLKSRYWEMAVSLAGPAMNLLMIIALCVPFWTGILRPDLDNVGALSLGFLIELQISAVIFNLLPLPPLDGFGALSPWIPQATRHRLLAQSGAFIWALFLVMFYVESVNRAFFTAVFAMMDLLQIDPRLAVFGAREFQFWK